MEVVTNIVVNLFQGILVTWYLIKCLGTEKDRRKVFYVGSISTFMYLMLQSMFTSYEGMGILVYLGLVVIFSFAYLGGSYIAKIFYSMMLILVLAFSAAMAGTFLGAIFSVQYMEIVNQKDMYHYLAIIVNQVILIGFLLIVVKMQEKIKGFFSDRYVMLSLLIPVITISICDGMLQMAESQNDRILYVPVLVAALVAINIITIILIMKEQRLCHQQAEAVIRMETYEHQKKDVEEIKKVYVENKKTQHEINRVMEMTQYLLENNQVDKAKSYIKEFQHVRNQQETQIIYTDHAIINHMLNRKMELCKESGISVKCLVSGDFEGVSDIDIHILLENLIDNAIEAAKKVTGGKVDISIYGDIDGIGIEINNSVVDDFMDGNPEFKTTKKNKYNHGYGIQNVKEIIEKYNGVIEYRCMVKNVVTCKVVIVKNIVS